MWYSKHWPWARSNLTSMGLCFLLLFPHWLEPSLAPLGTHSPYSLFQYSASGGSSTSSHLSGPLPDSPPSLPGP